MAGLIVYYSRAGENYFGGEIRWIAVGNTEKAAMEISVLTGADLFRIRQKVTYAENYKTCIRQAKMDQETGARPELEKLPDSLDGYDEIYLGYPNYWGDMPMAVYTFLEAFDWTGKTIYPFCTNEGSGLSGTEQKIAAAARGASVAKGLSLRGSRIEQSGKEIGRWLMWR